MSWNFLEAQSREHIRTVWRRESDAMFDLAADPQVWGVADAGRALAGA